MLFLAILLTGCTDKEKTYEQDIIAEINGEKITLEEFENSFASAGDDYGSMFPLARKDKLKVKATHLNQMIEERLIIIEGKNLGIDVGKEEIDATIAQIKLNYGTDKDFEKVFINKNIDRAKWRKKIKRKLLIEKIISQAVSSGANITNEEVEEYFNKNRDEFSSDEQVRARQILLEDELEAAKARERIWSGEKFEDVAKEVSLSPDGKEGGDLGFFSRGVMPPEFDEVVFTLEVDRLSEVVRSTYGYHIFLVEERKAARDLSLDEVKDTIEEILKRDMEEYLYRKWMDELRRKTKIKTNEKLLGRTIILR